MNGCGPAWVPRNIKKYLFDWFHEASCNKHDQGYAEGGNEARRWECDFKFFVAMLKDSWRVKKFFFIRVFVAIAFYLMVMLFGWSSFNYK
ncbi:hypothetical protein [uncultured Mediterranean phage uvMED]|nr:hypothetical protein [uncultured Mediterranean phage uvMED]